MTPPLKKFRYEFPPTEARFLEAPTAEAAVRYLRRIYPHNALEVLPTLREIARWPAFWTTVDAQGLEIPRAVLERDAGPAKPRA